LLASVAIDISASRKHLNTNPKRVFIMAKFGYRDDETWRKMAKNGKKKI
jgi:hypothetical protein